MTFDSADKAIFVDPNRLPTESHDKNDFVRHVEDGCPYREDDVMQAEKGGVSTGTTILAIEFEGGVIMGADSRTSTGDYIANRVSRKVTRVHDRLYVCRSGSAADTQALTGFVQHYLSQHSMELEDTKFPLVNTCASLFNLLAYKHKDNLMAGLIIGGYDKAKGGQVYCIPLGGGKMRMPCVAGGSGSSYIMGLMDAEYKEGMGEEEARKMVKKWIAHAMRRDGSSGGVIRTMTIKEDGVFEDFTPGDKLPVDAL